MRLISRAHLLAGGAAALPVLAGGPARAAQFEYVCSHNLPVDVPMHVRSVELWHQVAKETNGRLVVKIIPNSALGADTAVMTQVRAGAVQMMCFPAGSGSNIVPGLGITTIGFAFRSLQDAVKAMDGPLGAEMRKQIESKGFVVVAPQTFELGLRQLTNSVKPIVTAADLAGLKLRVPPTRSTVDLFRTLGASPTALDFAEAYSALQTHLVDGTELPFSTVLLSKYYEVQKYMSIANHTWAGFWLVCNPAAWQALPADIQEIVRRNATKYIKEQRRDIFVQEPSMIDKLRRLGMQINRCETESFRAKLAPYYVRWKAEFGTNLWTLLEEAVGKLG